MLILNQNRNELINLDNVVIISKIEEGDSVFYKGYTIDDYKFILGSYEDTPEHENQLEKIAEHVGAIEIYRMPEE